MSRKLLLVCALVVSFTLGLGASIAMAEDDDSPRDKCIIKCTKAKVKCEDACPDQTNTRSPCWRKCGDTAVSCIKACPR